MKYILIILLFLTSTLLRSATYYVSTTGSDAAAGTIGAPWATWQKGVLEALPGDTVYIRGGVYQPTGHIMIGEYETGSIGMLIRPSQNQGVSGTAANPICYFASPGETPILDGSLITTGAYNQGITAEYVEYIHFKGLTIRHMVQASGGQAMGFATVPCANLTFTNCVVHDIGGRGFYFSSAAWNSWDGADSPFASDTTKWINCDAYNLCDSLSANPGNAADGWKCHGYQGNKLYWYGCRAWNYSDDGIDPSGECYKIIERCWVMPTLKYEQYVIEGNGFKLSAPASIYYFPELLTDTILARITNCIALYCQGSGGSGFLNDLVMNGVEYVCNNGYIYNNVAYRCDIGFTDGGTTVNPIYRTSIYRNNISAYSSEYTAAIYHTSIYTAEKNTWVPTMEVNDWPGWEVNPEFTLSDDDFISIDSSLIRTARKADGSLPDINLFKLKSDSDLKGAGVNVGMSATPDIGIDWAYLGQTYIPVYPFVLNRKPAVYKGKTLIFR